MLKFKGCPKCKGSMHSDDDAYGPYMVCINCGYVQDLQCSDQPEMKLVIRDTLPLDVLQDGRLAIIAHSLRLN